MIVATLLPFAIGAFTLALLLALYRLLRGPGLADRILALDTLYINSLALLIVRLGLVVLWDIVLSNIEVARRILGPEEAIRPAFVWMPLELTDPHAIVSLAGIITMTPGTLSAELSPDRRHLLVHAFNVDDEPALIAQIKARYESPLKEIFR